MVMLSLLVDLNTSSTTVSNCMGLDIMLILKMHLYVPFYVGVLSHTITNVVHFQPEVKYLQYVAEGLPGLDQFCSRKS